jgi:hypothetical protein
MSEARPVHHVRAGGAGTSGAESQRIETTNNRAASSAPETDQ